MKIEKIEISDYRGIRYMNEEPAHINALVGKNGTGKTSFLDAIGTVLNSKPNGEHIRKGCPSAEILMESGGMEIGTVYGKTNRYTVNGKKVRKQDYDAVVKDISGIPADEIRIVTSSEVAMGLGTAELTGFLMKYIPEAQTADKVMMYADDLDDRAKEVLRRNLPDGEFGLDVLEQVHDALVECRKQSKRDLAGLSTRTATEMEPPAMNEEEAKEAYEAAVSSAAKAEMARKQMAAWERAEKTVREQEEKIAYLKKDIASITATKVSESTKASLEEKESDARERKMAAIKAKEALVLNIEHNKDVLDALEDDTCVICRNLDPDMAFVCRSPEKLKTRDAIKALVKTNEEAAAAQDAVIKKADEEIAKIQEKKKEIAAQEAAYSRKVALMGQLDALESAKVPLPKKPEEAKDIGDIAARKAECEAVLRKIRDYKAYLKDKEAAVKKTAELKAYDDAVKSLEPKGSVMGKVMGHYVDLFDTVIKGSCASIREGFSVDFFMDDGVRFTVTPKAGKASLGYGALSSGEKRLCSLVFLDMLNQLTGLGILVMDDMEQMDTEAFTETLNALSGEFSGRYDHIFLSMVDHGDMMAKLHEVLPGAKVLTMG